MSHTKHLRQLLQTDNLAQFLTEMLEATEHNGQKELHNAIIMQSGSFHQNENANLAGTISFDNYTLTKNRIKAALLHYLEEYEDNDTYQWKKKEEQKSVIFEPPTDDLPITPPYNPPSNMHYENGYALLIGIKYAHWNGIGLLNGTLNDIRDLKAHFTDQNKAAYKPENVITLTEENATTANIFQALKDLATKANQNKDASVIVYYSGHGETDGRNHFLVPYDFNLRKWLDHNTFDTDKVVLSKDFTKALDQIQAKKCLIVLDCCHAADIPADKSLQAPPQFFEKFLSDIPAEEITEKSIGAQIAQGKGRVILTSCQGEEKSLDIGTNGLFTQVLLESLNGAKNIEEDGWVRLIDLIRYVPKNVSAKATARGKKQNPVFKRIEDLGAEDFVVCAYNIGRANGLDKLDTQSNIEKTSKDTTQLEIMDNFVPLPNNAKMPINYQAKRFIDIAYLIESGLVLLVTATKIETATLHQKLKPLPQETAIWKVRKYNATYFIGTFGRVRVAHVECGTMGTGSSMGSLITITNAINDLEPKFALMLGIAFGINPTKQNIGDVLVSNTIIPYEMQRIGEKETIKRNPQPEASNSLRNAFNNMMDWEYLLPNGKPATLSVCDILSGEKLVDNLTFRNSLETQFRTAKGGEMEGAGLYVACQDKKIDWILVKSICDFADGNKGEHKEEKQDLAIDAAINACLHLFEEEFVFEDLGVFEEMKEVKSDTPKNDEGITVNGNGNTLITNVSNSNINNGNGNQNPPPVSSDKDEILHLIDFDLDKAFNILDEKYLHKNPNYNALREEYVFRDNSFNERTYKSRLKGFVNLNWK